MRLTSIAVLLVAWAVKGLVASSISPSNAANPSLMTAISGQCQSIPEGASSSTLLQCHSSSLALSTTSSQPAHHPSHSATLTWSPAHIPSDPSSVNLSSVYESTSVSIPCSMSSSASASSTPIVNVPIPTLTPTVVILTTSSILIQPKHSHVVGRAVELYHVPGTVFTEHAIPCTQIPSSTRLGTSATSTSTLTTTIETTITIAKPSHSSMRSTTDSNRLVYTSMLSADGRCPYPLPGIYCGEPRTTLITETREGISTATKEKGEKSTATVECPYPGQKC
jgi:hypothetical protein